MQLEDREIEDNTNDGLHPYTPLERPDLGSDVKRIPEEESVKESDAKCSSGSDSDDNLLLRTPKMRRMVNPPQRPARNKYSVWCKASAEYLSDSLGAFGVPHHQTDRGVESYPLPLLNKRKRKIPARKLASEKPELPPVKKTLKPLEESEMSTFESLASDIATKLSESNYDLVLRIVVNCGKKKAIEFYNRTREIEESGGMFIANKSQRRTSGGIFILLVRNNKDITKDQKSYIFIKSNKKGKRFKNDEKKQQRNRNFKDWLKEMNYERAMESGQEELNHLPPSPSPESHCPEPLPELSLRQEIPSYSDLNLHQSSDSEDVHYETPQNSELPAKFEHTQLNSLSTEVDDSPKSPSRHDMNASTSKKHQDISREVVEYDDAFFNGAYL